MHADMNAEAGVYDSLRYFSGDTGEARVTPTQNFLSLFYG